MWMATAKKQYNFSILTMQIKVGLDTLQDTACYQTCRIKCYPRHFSLPTKKLKSIRWTYSIC